MDVDPEGGYPVKIPPAVYVPEETVPPLFNYDGCILDPLLHLGEGVPDEIPVSRFKPFISF